MGYNSGDPFLTTPVRVDGEHNDTGTEAYRHRQRSDMDASVLRTAYCCSKPGGAPPVMFTEGLKVKGTGCGAGFGFSKERN